MTQNIAIPLMFGCLSLFSVLLFKFVLKDFIKKAFRKGIIINDSIMGVYSLMLAAVAVILKLDAIIVVYFLVGGIFIIGFVTMIPAVIKMARENKGRDD